MTVLICFFDFFYYEINLCQIPYYYFVAIMPIHPSTSLMIASLKPARRLGFTPIEAQEVIHHLNQLLCNYHIYYQKLRNFHWNVQGSDFFDLHDNFEQLYNTAKVNIDDIAERIRIFGTKPISTLQEYLTQSKIEEPNPNDSFTGKEMVDFILADMETLLSYMINVIHAATDIGDVGTIDLVNGFIKNLEKRHWMLRAWLSK